ncbi:MAG TPA: vitamin K epoxide reductase family protein [Myxococcales bacterium LLY-WYZ-16_1]|nr:vitamin K epoxide reductase family protein [Myxococcales bacterium LLY-WYZ-16_1]
MAKGKKRSKGRRSGTPNASKMRGPSAAASRPDAPKAAAPAPDGAPADRPWLWAAAVLGLAVLGLGIVQWVELLQAQAGSAPFCSLNERVNCATVWNSPFAKAIHRATGVPLAGWGIVWGFAAAVTAGWAAFATGPAPGLRWAARLTGIAGVLSCVVFLVASLAAGAICLTCLATYAGVLAFAGTTWGFRAGKAFAEAPLGPLLGVPLAAVVVGYGAVLGPGLQTPVSPTEAEARQAEQALEQISESDPESSPPEGADEDEKGEPVSPAPASLQAFLAQLPGPARQAVAEGVQSYRDAAQRPTEPPRHVQGSPDAPVRILDFVDVLCGHCAHLHHTLERLRSMFPPSAFSVETRFFPLDGACNPNVSRSSPDPAASARCVGPKAMICAESDPGYGALKAAVFGASPRISADQIRSMARTHLEDVEPAEFEDCLESEQTEAALRADVTYAMGFDIQGTPLVLVNGRQVRPALPLLMALILAEGDPNHPAFDDL